MRSDAIVVGAELDGQIAALRLLERGYSVRIFARGAGSLHYAPGGIRLLGFTPEQKETVVDLPFDRMAALDDRHPYRLAGEAAVRQALEWFFSRSDEAGQQFLRNGKNHLALTPAGLGNPTYASFDLQACQEKLRDADIAIVRFRGHRDFPAGLVAKALRTRCNSVSIVDMSAPGDQSETITIAQTFDRLPDPHVFFRKLAEHLNPGTEMVLLPALLGIEAHTRIVDATAGLDFACFEVPTLPPSIPGMRLDRAMEACLQSHGAMAHRGSKVTGERPSSARFTQVRDQQGRVFEASVFILASGGVLMGGLDVDSRGQVKEPVFDLAVAETNPLAAEQVDQTLDALHRAGVETDQHFRPGREASSVHDNLFVTGATLGNWSPIAEASAEGVSIVTGWAAAEAAHAYLEGR